MAVHREDIRPMWMLLRKVFHRIAGRAGVRENAPGEAVLTQISAPYMVGRGHITQEEALQTQTGIGLLPALAKRL